MFAWINLKKCSLERFWFEAPDRIKVNPFPNFYFSESLYPHTIFGVSLNDCLEQERSSRSHLKVPTEAQYVPKSPRGRSSFSSYIEVPKDSSEVNRYR